MPAEDLRLLLLRGLSGRRTFFGLFENPDVPDPDAPNPDDPKENESVSRWKWSSAATERQPVTRAVPGS